MADETQGFEKLLERLEEIVRKMEDGGLSLEESLALYEEGMKKTESLNEMLKEARERVQKLVIDSNGEARLELFETEGEGE